MSSFDFLFVSLFRWVKPHRLDPNRLTHQPTVNAESDVWGPQIILDPTIADDRSMATSAVKLNKQTFWAAEGSDWVDCRWEGFIKGGDNLSLSPEERSVWTGWMGIRRRPYQETERAAVLDTYTAHKISVQSRRQWHAWTRTCGAHTPTSPVFCCLGAHFCRKTFFFTGWTAQERSPWGRFAYFALHDMWEEIRSEMLDFVCFCQEAFVWAQRLKLSGKKREKKEKKKIDVTFLWHSLIWPLCPSPSLHLFLAVSCPLMYVFYFST